MKLEVAERSTMVMIKQKTISNQSKNLRFPPKLFDPFIILIERDFIIPISCINAILNIHL